jgi:succinate dehydrogenase/fumarate reductase flavoprotein subunit
MSLTQPVQSQTIDRWAGEADVVVVGYGGAGACVALEAARGGASVVILERASGGGGTTAMCGGHVYAGGGTSVQRACGFEDDAEQLFQYLMACAPFQDEAKARLYSNGSVAHFEWLRAQGVPFNSNFHPHRTTLQLDDSCLVWTGNEYVWPFSARAKAAPRGHKVAGPFDAGHLIMKALMGQVERLAVPVVCDARVDSLVVDDGKVCGVVATQFGERKAYRARHGVALTAGGFVLNHAMLRNHAPDLAEHVIWHGSPGDVGDGVRLGMSAGGASIHMSEVFVTLPFYPPESLTFGIFVNATGQRFINEDCYHARIGHAAMHQAGGRVWLIVDDAGFGIPTINSDIHHLGRTDLQFEHVATEGSVAELETAIGLPAGALVHTVEQYNRFAADRQDPLFHKTAKWLRPLEPPFAAIDCSLGRAPYIGFTLGGLATLTTGEVLDDSNAIVPGLYAAGRTTCGLPRWSGGYASGLSVADATFFGRQAGRTLAALAAGSLR